MNSIKKRFLLTMWVVGLFSLTGFIVPSIYGINNNDSFYSTKGSDSFVEDFSTTSNMDGSSTSFGWGTGTVTNARDFSWNLLDHYYTESPVVDVEVQGRKAYLGLYNESQTDAITILNINNLLDIKLQGIENHSDFSQTKAIAVEGDYLLSGQKHTTIQDALVCNDVEDPFNPAWTWGSGLDNFITDIEIYGHIAFFTSYNVNNNRSLRYIDVEDPFNYVPYVSCDWDCNQSLGLTVNGGLAYIAASTEGFYVLNITNKAYPTEIGYVNTPGNATDVIVDGGFAYLADGPAGVHVIDIRDPSNPTILSTFDTPGLAQKLVKQGRTLFIADGTGKVQICDVFDPHHISIVTDIPAIPYTYDVALFGGDLIAGTQNGIYSIRIGYMANFSNSWYPNPFEAPEIWDVRVDNGIAYIAAGEDGVLAVDVRNPLQPSLIGNYVTGPGHEIRKIDVNGRFLYGIGPSDYMTFDISDPTDIKIVSAQSGGGLTDVFIHGELYYMSFVSGFAILNVSDNYNPVVITSHIPVATHVNNTAIWTQGTHVYMVEGNDGSLSDEFSCYGVTNFINPTLSYSGSRTTPMYDIHVDGDLAYLGAGGWLAIYNVSDPTAFTYPDYEITTSWGVWSFGRYVVSAEMAKGARLYDTTNVNDFELHSYYSAPTESLQVTMSGDYTYVANQTSLVTLRHFCSLADTYNPGTSFAQSMKISPDPKRLITEATLHKDDKVPFGTAVEYFMSADGGANWEFVTPGAPHVFANPGYDLRWRAEIIGPRDRSVHLYEIAINYEFNLSPTTPTLTDPGDTNALGLVSLKWTASSDADGTIAFYEVEVSTDASYVIVVKEYNVTSLKQSVYPLSSGTYYFRVRAMDDGGAMSDWSTADIEVTFSLLGPMWIGIIVGSLVLIIVLIVVISVLVRRKKKGVFR